MKLQRGQRLKLADLHLGDHLRVDITMCGVPVDAACFGLDSTGKLVDDAYMVFFNQPKSPCGGITLMHGESGTVGYDLSLGQLPDRVDRLVFTATTDGPGTMSQLAESKVDLLDAGTGMRGKSTKATFAIRGADFAQERAVMLIDIYRKDGAWRAMTNGQGFNGGLDALVRHFGADVAETTIPPAPAEPARISLEKRVAQAAPHLVNLAKKAADSLEKKGMSTVKARVGLVLDASGSMRGQYEKGRVQELLNRILPLAMHFDDDGAIDTWAFGSSSLALPEVKGANIQGYTLSAAGGWKQWMHKTAPSVNNEPAAINDVISHYSKNTSAPPAYVIFVSDGGVNKDREISQLIREASSRPIFWQFVGIGGRGYGILERLDTMEDRVVDNAGFFAIDDLLNVSEDELYDRLLGELPQWLVAAKAKGIIH